MAGEKEAPQTQALVRVKDIETRALVEPRIQVEFERLAKDLGVDLRMGHLMAMGGKPYLTHEGVKAMMHGPNGPGIKELKYTFVVDDWPQQQFIVTCHLVTRDGQVYEGDGDAIGIPVEEMKRISDEARKKSKDYDVIKRAIKDEVTAYPLKNVSSMIAMGFSSRRMAQTRAFNRAARFALKTSYVTIEETSMEESAYEGTAVVMPTDEQKNKIREFQMSHKAELQDLTLRHCDAYGKPEEWSADAADEYIQTAIKLIEENRKKLPPPTPTPKEPRAPTLAERDIH